MKNINFWLRQSGKRRSYYEQRSKTNTNIRKNTEGDGIMRPVFTILTLYWSLKKFKAGVEIEYQDWGNSLSVCLSLVVLHLYFRIPLKGFKKMSPEPVVQIICFER